MKNINALALYSKGHLKQIALIRLTGNFFNSSWEDYIQSGERGKFCDTGIILDQFAGISEYKTFAEGAIIIARERKELGKIVKLDLET